MSSNSRMGKTNRSSAGFMKGIVPPRVAEESYDSLDDMESNISKSPRMLTQDYMEKCRDTMHVVGSIIGEILANQEEDRIVKWVS